MPKLKPRRKFAPLALAVAICCSYPVSSLWAADTSAGKTVFEANCKSCHGVDGSGSPIGKSLNAPDLRSPAVQQHSSAQWATQIANGKGNMPAFKNILTPDQIQSLVRYVRRLGRAKTTTPK